MERLTIKEANGKYDLKGHRMMLNKDIINIIDCGMYKLGLLEDIEEELEFDLIKLFKSLYEGVYYIKNNQIVYGKVIGLYNEMINSADRPKYTGLYVNDIYVLFSDYGKTWSLTKGRIGG